MIAAPPRTAVVRAAPTSGRALVVVLAFATLLAPLSAGALNPFLPFIARDLGVVVPQVGRIVSLTLLVSAGLCLLAGPLADRAGHRHALAMGVCSLAAGALLVAVAPSLALLFLAAPFIAVSRTLVNPVAVAIAGARFAGEARRRAVSRVVGGTAGGAIVGLPLLSVVAGEFGWRAAFVVLAVAALALVALLLRLVAADSARPEHDRPLRSVLAAYPPLLRHLPTLGLYGGSFLNSAGQWAMGTYVAAFLAERFGFGPREVGGAFLAAGLGFLAGSQLVAHLRGPLPLRTLVMGAGVAQGLFQAAALSLPVPAVTVVLLASLGGAANGLSSATRSTLLVSEAPAGRATVMTLNQALGSLGAAAGVAAAGALVGLGGFLALAAALPLNELLGAGVILASRPRGVSGSGSVDR